MDNHEFNKYFSNKYAIRDKVKEVFKQIIKKINFPNTSLEYAVTEAKNAYKQSSNAEPRDISLDIKSGKISLDTRSIKDGYIYKQNTKQQLKKNYPKLREIFKEVILKKLIDHKLKSTQISELCYDGILKKWKLCVPYPVEQKHKTPKRAAIALDPGVRSFLTWYDGKSYGEIGKNMWRKLKKLDLTANKLQGKLQKCKNKHKKSRLNKAIRRLNLKVRNKVKDMHYKTCNLLTRYKYVFLPKFKVSDIVKKLNKRSRKPLLNLSHFQFKIRLIQKASETGTKVIICNEAYTSKTCSNCGTQNTKLGASKVFKCSNCHITADRDMNAARNIMIRVLSKSTRFKQNISEQSEVNLRGGSISAKNSVDKTVIPDHIKIKKDLKTIDSNPVETMGSLGLSITKNTQV